MLKYALILIYDFIHSLARVDCVNESNRIMILANVIFFLQ